MRILRKDSWHLPEYKGHDVTVCEPFSSLAEELSDEMINRLVNKFRVWHLFHPNESHCEHCNCYYHKRSYEDCVASKSYIKVQFIKIIKTGIIGSQQCLGFLHNDNYLKHGQQK
jgi:hypothetical protein